jgi:hypothetical protein
MFECDVITFAGLWYIITDVLSPSPKRESFRQRILFEAELSSILLPLPLHTEAWIVFLKLLQFLLDAGIRKR